MKHGFGWGDDVEGHRHGETFPKVTEVQLRSGKLPLNVCIILKSRTQLGHRLDSGLTAAERWGELLTSIFWKELVIMAMSMLSRTMTMTRVKMPYRILPTNSANTNSGMSTYSWLTTPNMVQNKKRKVSLNLRQQGEHIFYRLRFSETVFTPISHTICHNIQLSSLDSESITAAE